MIRQSRRWWSGLMALGLCLGTWRGALAQESMRLDVYDKSLPANKAIERWNSRKIAPLVGNGQTFFFQFVYEGPEEQYLHLKSGSNNSFSVGAEVPFRLQQWPVLEWEWKVTRLPAGGDVRVKSKDDQAGAVCVIVNPGLVGFDSLCYIWENEGPKDQPITSTKREDSKYLILRTGRDDPLGPWIKERRNMLEDYRRAFGKEPDRDAVIGVQIDSDDTASAAEAFYRRFFLLRG